MPAAITDLFNNATETTRPDPAALTAQKLIGAASITVDTTAGWPTSTAAHFTMYQVDAAGAKVGNTQTDWKGIVTSGTTIGSLTLKAGTDAVYPVGSKVICAPTGAWADDLATGLQVAHDQDGTLKVGAVDNAAVLASDVVTTAKILDANVTSAKLAENFLRGRYQSDTTNSAPTGLTIQYGWGFIVGDGTDKLEETVTFPTAFSSAPVVMCSLLNARLVADGAPTGVGWFTTAVANASNIVVSSTSITTSTFVLNMNRSDSVVMANTNNYGYTWIAIGTV